MSAVLGLDGELYIRTGIWLSLNANSPSFLPFYRRRSPSIVA